MIAVRRPLRLRGRYWLPKDGLWKVETRKRVLGGFLVTRGRVTRCSPAIRRHLHAWAARNAEVEVAALRQLLRYPMLQAVFCLPGDWRNRSTSLILRMDTLLVGKSDPPCFKQDQIRPLSSAVRRG